MRDLDCCECSVGNHYLLKCPSLGLFVALLKAWAVFHIPLRLMRTVLGPVAVILTNWACSCFSFCSPIYCNLNTLTVTETIWIFRPNYNTEHCNRISWEWSKWSLTLSKSISTGMMAVLKNLTKQLVNFTNDNDFFKVRWPLWATKIQASVKRHVTRVHGCLMPLVKTDARIF